MKTRWRSEWDSNSRATNGVMDRFSLVAIENHRRQSGLRGFSGHEFPDFLQSYCLFRAQGQNGARQLFVVGKAVIDLGRKAQPDRAVDGE
jgi:hypothetical protein